MAEQPPDQLGDVLGRKDRQEHGLVRTDESQHGTQEPDRRAHHQRPGHFEDPAHGGYRSSLFPDLTAEVTASLVNCASGPAPAAQGCRPGRGRLSVCRRTRSDPGLSDGVPPAASPDLGTRNPSNTYPTAPFESGQVREPGPPERSRCPTRQTIMSERRGV